MATMIKHLLQHKQAPGTTKTTLFTQLNFLTKDNMTAASCWDMPGQGLTIPADAGGRPPASLLNQADNHGRI